MRALLRFHLLGAAALAQRNVLATVAAVILSLVLVPNAPAVLRQIGLGIAAEGGRRGAGLLLTALGVGLAFQAAPTIRLGLGGWLRSLPLDHRQHRRALTGALALPQLPVLAAGAVAVLQVALAPRESFALAAIAGLPVSAVASGAVAVPVERGWLARPVAAAAAVTAMLGQWLTLAASLALLGLWDLLAGPVALPARPERRHRLATRWLGARIALRALGVRVIGPLVVAMLGVAAGWAYRVNNGLSVAEAGFGVRLALLVSLGVSTGLMADALLVRRRVWPWLRSLPTTARERVLEDASVLGLPGALALVPAAGVDWRAALAGAATVPLVALAAVIAHRRAGGKLLGITGSLPWFSVPVAVIVAIWPLSALAALAGAPGMLALAARADRREIVTGWQPLHHAVAGDSMAGSDR